MGKQMLVRDINVRTDETISACIIELDDNNRLTRKTELSEEELEQELDGPKWANPFPEWVGRGIQRLRHERK